MRNTNTLDSPTPNLGLNSPNSYTSFLLPAYLPGSDPHTVASSTLDHEFRQLSYAALASRLSPEQLRAKHWAQVEEEIAIWLGLGPLLLTSDPKNPLKKENVNMVDYWKLVINIIVYSEKWRGTAFNPPNGGGRTPGAGFLSIFRARVLFG
ncbi:hypothetical protein FRC11_003384 [Ceratobasidium sp. 423]|nr:hypothetical protein FRC11_003384 [Ceratobasidium sp. 423]